MKPLGTQPDWQAESRGIAVSAAVMASGTMMSRVLGLFRDIITAAYFDRTVTDAWIVAFGSPIFFGECLVRVASLLVLSQFLSNL